MTHQTRSTGAYVNAPGGPKQRDVDPGQGASPVGASPAEFSGQVVSVRASKVRPRDYLPPQRCLDPTPWQDSGFPVGPRSRDVRFKKVPGVVLLSGPLGVLDALQETDTVLVMRAGRRARRPSG